jgi:hypothetical protein
MFSACASDGCWTSFSLSGGAFEPTNSFSSESMSPLTSLTSAGMLARCFDEAAHALSCGEGGRSQHGADTVSVTMLDTVNPNFNRCHSQT